MDWQTAEFAVHAWDLARAIGYAGRLDPEVAERGLAFMTASLTDESRGGAFGPAVPVRGRRAGLRAARRRSPAAAVR